MKTKMACVYVVLALSLALMPALAAPETAACSGDVQAQAAPIFLSPLVETLQPVPSPTVQGITPLQCASFCSRVRCVEGQFCSLYTNVSGQTVCGCHGSLGGA
ncbi:MAG TPA: hypothetical protein VF173_20385 [Thermoanaerobaculia bacterium]|nr:hypothetical protein [Thermoanaerobaculia bacterium]